MNEVFAFEWNLCIYDSDYSIISLHKTKYGAFKAMIKEANKRWQNCRNGQLQYGIGRYTFSPLTHEAWRVRAIQIDE